MKSVPILSVIVFFSMNVFAGTASQSFKCVDDSGKVKATISSGGTGGSAESSGFEVKGDASTRGADHTLFKAISSSIVSDEQESMVSAFALGADGSVIHIVATDLMVPYCHSNCPKVITPVYTNVVAASSGAHRYVSKSNLKCNLVTK